MERCKIQRASQKEEVLDASKPRQRRCTELRDIPTAFGCREHTAMISASDGLTRESRRAGTEDFKHCMLARHLPINRHPKSNLGLPGSNREETKLSIDMQCIRLSLLSRFRCRDLILWWSALAKKSSGAFRPCWDSINFGFNGPNKSSAVVVWPWSEVRLHPDPSPS